MRYSRAYLGRSTSSSRRMTPSPSTTSATAVTVGAASSTAPRRLQGCSSTTLLLRRRLTLPLPAGVVTTRASPSRPIQTGVGTLTPFLRKVVSETNFSSPRESRVVAVGTGRRYPDAALVAPGAPAVAGPGV